MKEASAALENKSEDRHAILKFLKKAFGEGTKYIDAFLRYRTWGCYLVVLVQLVKVICAFGILIFTKGRFIEQHEIEEKKKKQYMQCCPAIAWLTV